MFRMIKWTLGSVVAGGLVLFLVFGSSASSYVGTAIGSARQRVKAAIPIDFEIKRSERLIRQIAPQIQESLREVALGEVELAELRDGIGELKKREGKLHARLLRRKEMLETGEPAYYVAGLKMERRRLELDLERVFEDYRTVKSLLKGKEKLHAGQERALVAARRKLEGVLAERAHLREMLKSLKTQKRQVDALAAQARKFELDDSSLVQARNSLKEVKKRLDVAQRMLEADLLDYTGFPEEGEASVPAPTRNILQEVNSFLGKGKVKQIPEAVGSAQR